MTTPRNLALAGQLHEVAALLRARRADRFAARAYRDAARLLAGLPVDVGVLSAEQRRRLRGVGPAVQRAIEDHLATGVVGRLASLHEEEPPGLGILLQVQGVSPRIGRALAERGIADLAGLARLVADGGLTGVPGVGPTTAEVIADGIGRIDHLGAGRLLLRQARLLTLALTAQVDAIDGVEAVRPAGPARRGVRQPDHVALVAVTGTPEVLAGAVAALPTAVAELPPPPEPAAGPVVSVLLDTGRRADVHLAMAASAGTALVEATGPPAHVQALRARGLGDSADETEAYRSVGLPVTPAPARDAALLEDPPGLVELGDVVGDLHVHSAWSGDGHEALDALADAAVARGYGWLAVTDHTEDLTMNGMTRDELAGRRVALRRVAAERDDVVLLEGAELNIGRDGGLDYDLLTRLELEWCVASVHSLFRLPAAQQTARILAAIDDPAVDAIGHPVGRLLGVRPGYRIDLTAIAQAAAESGTALEVNGSPRRLDLDADLVAVALREGAAITVSSDAHRCAELDYMREAVLTAQRGGAGSAVVVSALALSDLRSRVAAKRARAPQG